MKALDKFIKDQLSVWPLSSSNFRALKAAKTRKENVYGLNCILQHNPERIISTTADTSDQAIAARPCFLCEEHRHPEQFHLTFEGRKARMYNIQLNPYPIFPKHLVVVRKEHVPQAIWHHFPDMLSFTMKYPDYTVFYNGPHCGASAPDHLHFQAVPRGHMPLEKAIDSFLDNPGEPLARVKDASLYHYCGFTRGVFAFKASTPKSLAKLVYRLLECSNTPEGQGEPMFNLYTYRKVDEYRCFVVLRCGKRSHHYYSQGPDHLTLSPGAADMAGVLVLPYKEDFDKADATLLTELLSEVTISEEEQKMILWRLTRRQTKISVGILSAEEIQFEIISDGAGKQKVSYCDGRISYNGQLYDELYFDSITRSTLFSESSFILYDVVIGIDFHWQQTRDLKYAGALKFIVEGDKITAINCVGMEDYLLSVISSEMKSTSNIELLKAHAVISRSWLQARLNDRATGNNPPHERYDVCADDHCQRYQGLSMVENPEVRKAIDQTWGQLLTCHGELCDTRYSKCCGGKTELFSTCWEDVDYPYLQCVDDQYCDCESAEILSQVLNDYDMHTRDFHDWTVRYTQEELSALVKSRSGEDYGTILNLVPLQRGPSGRISHLRIEGSLQSKEISKELTIRRYLSTSHLKSSAFEVGREGTDFILTGKGWGHGVGLCQIGAAVMASEGFDYKQILAHYYVGSQIEE